MQDEILNDLKILYSSSLIIDEKLVIYTLLELRKILDYIDQPSNYNNLIRFYGDWVAHIKMDRKATQELLDELDKYVWDPDHGFTSSNYEFISLKGLQHALQYFFKRNNISTDILDNDWKRFRNSLVKIIARSPLIGKNKLIEEFSYKVNSDRVIEYHVKLVDGRVKDGYLLN